MFGPTASLQVISVESFLPERSSYVLFRTFSLVSMLRESFFVFELEASVLKNALSAFVCKLLPAEL